MELREEKPRRGWGRKFHDAGRGVALGVYCQSSFLVHGAAAVLVIAAAAWLGVSADRWCLLLLCISGVFATELLNSALESLAKAIDQEPNQHLRNALDIASGAVLVFCGGAAAVGIIVFLPYLSQ